MITVAEIDNDYPQIREIYPYLSVLSFERQVVTFSNLKTTIKVRRVYIPSFIKFSLVEKRFPFVRFIPIISNGDISTVYASYANLTDNNYTMEASEVLIASNNPSDLAKIKLVI